GDASAARRRANRAVSSGYSMRYFSTREPISCAVTAMLPILRSTPIRYVRQGAQPVAYAEFGYSSVDPQAVAPFHDSLHERRSAERGAQAGDGHFHRVLVRAAR